MNQRSEAKAMAEEGINIRVTLSPGDPVRAKFEQIKGELGITSNVQVFRALVTRYRLKRGE